jgi:hypothetical protein
MSWCIILPYRVSNKPNSPYGSIGKLTSYIRYLHKAFGHWLRDQARQRRPPQIVTDPCAIGVAQGSKTGLSPDTRAMLHDAPFLD